MERLAVVTGGGSGVGRATARALAARGLEVICVGRRLDPLVETVELIGGGAAVAADVSSAKGVRAVLEAVGSRSVATFVHAAGIEGLVSLADTDRATFDALVATNLGGPFFLTQALESSIEDGGSRRSSRRRAPRKRRRSSPRIALVCSSASRSRTRSPPRSRTSRSTRPSGRAAWSSPMAATPRAEGYVTSRRRPSWTS